METQGAIKGWEDGVMGSQHELDRGYESTV